MWLEDHIYEIKDPDIVQPLNQFIKELEQSKNEAERKWSEMLMKSWTHSMKKVQIFIAQIIHLLIKYDRRMNFPFTADQQRIWLKKSKNCTRRIQGNYRSWILVHPS